ncbi:hypothetical protein GGX14DRAFT_573055 [Mycena pura]|uniref:FAD-binding domain-containing protein n=1 Tax=Mycena pura TaxID=153505 RepID=A0AAD6V0D0_9AGAR|nr:hypothetical protein GGX14DRAFT_573055 [Mycena pura]
MSTLPNPPTQTEILVIGGGPAGSYAAAALQREGHQVTVLEADKFPRYHIGESLLPMMRNYLDFIGAAQAMENHGFIVKPGAAFRLVHGIPETWTEFLSLGPGFQTWNVIRSEMDDLLLKHAGKQGASVFEETRVKSIDFSGEPGKSRPIAANWVNKSGQEGKIAFEWLVDASGRAGVMSTKYLKNRHMRESLRNIAVWGYWTGAKRYAAGTPKANSGWFEALTDESGWSWTIPLHDGTTSIGFVMHQDFSIAKKAKTSGLKEHYLDQLQFCPGVRELLGEDAKLVEGSIKTASDYSYFASSYSGDHFRVIGDAANFVDPFFSSGVHIALTGGLSAAVTICASIKGEATEEVAQKWHDSKVGIAHTRFLFVVLGAYQQMQLQSYPILSDVDAENFDEAFKMFYPGAVIFGLADGSTALTDSRVREMMDRFQHVFDPHVDEENVKAVRARYGADIVTVKTSVFGASKIEEITKDDEEAYRVMMKTDTMKALGDDLEATSMGRSPSHGYIANIERGKLGLRSVAVSGEKENAHSNGSIAL